MFCFCFCFHFFGCLHAQASGSDHRKCGQINATFLFRALSWESQVNLFKCGLVHVLPVAVSNFTSPACSLLLTKAFQYPLSRLPVHDMVLIKIGLK